MKIELTTAQEKHAVRLFVEGNSRSEVVTVLIETDPDINSQATDAGDTAAFRKALSDKLRSCDPNCTHFSRRKHMDYFKEHKAALTHAISNQYQSLVLKSPDWLRADVSHIDSDIDALSAKLESPDLDISDYIRIIKARDALRKRKTSAQDKLLERLERIHQQTIAF